MGNHNTVTKEMGVLHLTLGARALPIMDHMSQSDPFLVVFKKQLNGAFTAVKRTEVVLNNCEPRWEEITFQMGEVNTEMLQDVVFKLEILDDDGDGAVEALATGVYRLDQLEILRWEISAKMKCPVCIAHECLF